MNATLKDYATELGISENDVNRYLIDGSKIQRERERIGVVAEKEHEKKTAQIEVIGFDGKQCDTKVEEETSIRVMRKGTRGPSDKVEQTAVVTRKVEHYSVNGSTPDHPKGVYLDQVEPDGGTGKSIGREVVSLMRSKGIVESLKGVRTDGTATMTGIHTGAI